MTDVGAGVAEIRIHTGLEHRVLYVAKFAEAVFVLHAFQKRKRRASRVDIELARRRLENLLLMRRKKKESWMKMRVRHSSGNVFRDVGFGGEEAENLRLRADLMIQLTRLIDARRLTQARAARLFGVTQPRVSDLVRGRIERFSIDGLVEMLGRAGVRVSLVVRTGRRVA
jgi:predicted XRE-type DNA-binding protein